MRGRAHVGCSGWQYRDWRGLVYPERLPQRRWFEHYATLFDTVEVNNSFYRLPTEAAAEAWAAQAPPGFVYALSIADELDRMSAKVKTAYQIGPGKWAIELDDGAVWQQTDSEPVRRASWTMAV